MMRRRDFVRSLIAAVFASKGLMAQQTARQQLPIAAPVPWTLGLNPKTPIPQTVVAEGIAEAKLSFFTAPQMESMKRLCDLLMPPLGGKPGALDAGTPQFLDMLIGQSPESRKKIYAGGLDWIEAESQRKYKLAFAKLDDGQASALLKPWLRTWMSDHPPVESHADFVNLAHDDIREATFNSEAWAESATASTHEGTPTGVYWSPVDPESAGMGASQKPHVQAAKGVAKMPVYSR
jgi:hypothetical protein